MEEVARFFWERWKRGCQMGGRYELDAMEWQDAYRNTLSKNKQKEFDKYYQKCEDELQAYYNASPKQLKKLKSPMRIPV